MRNSCDIIILSMNNYRFTKACLDSLFSCEAGFPHSVHLLDNASTDGTPDNVARDFSGRVRVWRSDRNLGFAGGNNIVLGRTKGRFACLLNNDTVVTPGWLGEMVAAMEHDCRVGIVGCRGNNANREERPEQAVDFDTTLDALDTAGLHQASVRLSRAQPRFKNLEQVVGYCMLLRRTMLNKVGLLDARFWPGNFEDNDLCLRAVEAGYKAVVANRSFVYHFVSSTMRHIRWQHMFAVNRELFDRKWTETGRTATVGARPRERLKVAVEMPRNSSTAKKLLSVCEELQSRGNLVHTFGPPNQPPSSRAVPHIAASDPEKRYADCKVVLHCFEPPEVADGRVHVYLMLGRGRYNTSKCHRLVFGRSDDRRFAPEFVSVRWLDAVRPRRGELAELPPTFYDMVDRVEEHLRDIGCETP